MRHFPTAAYGARALDGADSNLVFQSGVETLPTSSVTSRPRLSTCAPFLSCRAHKPESRADPYAPTSAFKDYYKSLFSYTQAKDGYALWMAGNLASGGAAGATSLLFVYSLDYARTRLAADNKSTKKGATGERQFNGLIDVYKKVRPGSGLIFHARGRASWA